jgi:hypothetical protein
LQIGEQYVREGGTEKWPAWEIHPATPWNYGLALKAGNPAASFKVVRRPWPTSDMPFTHSGAPLALRAQARRIPEWELDRLGLVGLLQDSPVRSDQPLETVTLIPMGAARLRLSAFPVIGKGPKAKQWLAPPKPLYRTSASHCWEADTTEAMADGREPKGSNDRELPRFTWWPRKGTTEWVQYDFAKPRRVSAVRVYWFDDTPIGGCGLPASWRVLYRHGDQWREAASPQADEIAKDKYNCIRFQPVETAALRLEVNLQPGLSGGILEWKVD